MVEFRDVVKKYAGTDEALGVPAGTVGGIPVVTPDDLGPAAAMTPAEVVTDEDAQAALSGAFAALNAGREGIGMPEGVVSAPVGTVYRDLAATSGAVLWVKASGTGNTGWRVVWGDTGWRAIATWDTAGVITGTPHWNNMGPVPGEAGGIFLRRINERVLLALHSVRFTNSSSSFQGGPIQQSGGFRFPGPGEGPGARRTIPMRDLSMRGMARPGYVYLVGASGQQTYAEGSTVEWVTTDPWPTSLPGTPA